MDYFWNVSSTLIAFISKNLEKETVSGNIVDLKVLKRLFVYALPYKGVFIFLTFLTIALSIVGPLRPIIIQKTIDENVANGDYPGLVDMILLLIGLLILQAFIQYLHTFYSGWLGQNIIKDIRIKEYGVTRLAAIIFNHRKNGYDIDSMPLKKKTRFGRSTTISKYIYSKPIESYS